MRKDFHAYSIFSGSGRTSLSCIIFTVLESVKKTIQGDCEGKSLKITEGQTVGTENITRAAMHLGKIIVRGFIATFINKKII